MRQSLNLLQGATFFVDEITFTVMAPVMQALTSSKQYSKNLYGKTDRNYKIVYLKKKIWGKYTQGLLTLAL